MLQIRAGPRAGQRLAGVGIPVVAGRPRTDRSRSRGSVSVGHPVRARTRPRARRRRRARRRSIAPRCSWSLHAEGQRPAMASRCSVSGPLTSGAARQRVRRARAERRAVLGQHARPARGLLGVAHPPAVEDHPVAEQSSTRLRSISSPIACSTLTGSSCSVQPPAPDQPAEVGVDGDARDVERVAEDDVGGLAADAGQRDQLVERVAAPRRRTARRAPARAASASWPCSGRSRWAGSCSSSSVAVGLRVVERRSRYLREQRRGGQVDPLVGALRGQDGRHRQLERGGEVELAVHVRKRLGERALHPPRAADQPECGSPASNLAGAPRLACRYALDCHGRAY